VKTTLEAPIGSPFITGGLRLSYRYLGSIPQVGAHSPISHFSLPMADYYQLIARAVARLGKNTNEVRRAALYAHARGALVIELCSVSPPLSEPEITHECMLFEEAICKIEATLTPLSPTATVRATLPSGPEHPQHEPLIGSPTTGREPSREAYMPNSNGFGVVEPPIELSSDPGNVPCPVPLRPGGELRHVSQDWMADARIIVRFVG
jgi:hypothetical protein